MLERRQAGSERLSQGSSVADEADFPQEWILEKRLIQVDHNHFYAAQFSQRALITFRSQHNITSGCQLNTVW